MTSELKPCPFCGSADVEVCESITDVMVACNNCGSRTGLAFLVASDAANAAKIKEVVGLWNTRPTPKPDGGEDATGVESEGGALNETARSFNTPKPDAKGDEALVERLEAAWERVIEALTRFHANTISACDTRDNREASEEPDPR